MAEKDSKNPDNSTATNSNQSVGVECLSAADPSLALKSEALAQLDVLRLQFEAISQGSIDIADDNYQLQLKDCLCRIRNTLVIMEKSAAEYVIRELLALVDADMANDPENRARRHKILRHASLSFNQVVSQMHTDILTDNALAMIPLINDCRVCREEMLFSDVFMLAAGVELPEVTLQHVSEEDWQEQQSAWIDFALVSQGRLREQCQLWWDENSVKSASSIAVLLDECAILSARHVCLRALTPLFQSASLVASALVDEQLHDGPAVRNLYEHLAYLMQQSVFAASPDELVPADLLRNFLYYAAQVDSECKNAVELRRRFRLDRVRQVATATQIGTTPTIGVAYHLTNAIRQGVTRETDPLRSWLDAAHARCDYRKLVRLKVRLSQLSGVLTLMGATDALQCLQQISGVLQSVKQDEDTTELVRLELSQLFSRLDTLLDQHARQSVLGPKPVQAVEHCTADRYLDMATDACLRETRIDIQAVMERLSPAMQARCLDDETGLKLAEKLESVNKVLQVLPLPEVSPLFASLTDIFRQLPSHPAIAVSSNLTSREVGQTGNSTIQRLLCKVLIALDDYLGCVLQPQPLASQFLIDAEGTLEELKLTLSQSMLQQDKQKIDILPARASETQQSSLQIVSNAVQAESVEHLSLSDIGSMTLDIDDDLLPESSEDEEQYSMDSTLQVLFRHECEEHLDNLEEAIHKALRPSSNNDLHLPNEQMLRALHTLTGSAQTLGATQVTAIVQPLQRAALALHREGGSFDASQTRFVGELVPLLRARLASVDDDLLAESQGNLIEHKLNAFLAQTLSGMRANTNDAPAAPDIDAQIKTLDDVFFNEASDLLDSLRAVVRGKPFNKQSVNHVLSVLHTLKGSARMAGKLSISDSAHSLEARLKGLDSVTGQLETAEAGYRSLHDALLHGSARQMTQVSAGNDAFPVRQPSTSNESAMQESPASEKMQALATDLTVNQAGLAEELECLRLVCEDLESTLLEWREYNSDGKTPDKHFPADILDEMEASRSALRSSVRRAQKQQRSASRVSADLQQSLVRSRLVRMELLRERLTDVIGDMASSCGVSARFVLSGSELLLEKDMYRQLIAPLEHLVRNAVVHGIESPLQRTNQKKPKTGTICLDASFDGGDLVLKLSDDGRGISLDALNKLLDEQGQSRIDDSEGLKALLFSSGFSSVQVADANAGHGLGLAAVSAVVQKLNGQVELHNDEMQGVCITLRIPQKMVVMQVVLVKDHDRLYGIPIADVRSVHLSPNTSAVDSSNESTTTTIALSRLLGKPGKTVTRSAMSREKTRSPQVELEVNGQRANLAIEKIVGYREITTQGLGEQLASMKDYRSGGVLPSGQQVLILDIAQLLVRWNEPAKSDTAANYEPNRPVALIVDNSVVWRTISQSALQQRGIQTRLCNDGLEALDSLALGLPSIMIVDMDLPRLDGSALLRRISRKYAKAAPLVIAISNQNDSRSRERALRSGAAGFLCKPFTEQQLQEAVNAAGLRLPDLTIA